MNKILLCTLLAVGYSGSMFAIPAGSANVSTTTQPGTDLMITKAAPDGSIIKERITSPETPDMLTAKSRAMAETETYTVTVISDPNSNGVVKQFWGVYFIKNEMQKWPGGGMATEANFQLPAGDYIMQAVYNEGENIFLPVTLEEDMEIHLTPEMADHAITAELKMPDGSPVSVPGGSTTANIQMGTISTRLAYKGFSASAASNYYLDGAIFREQCTILTNLVDEDTDLIFLFSGVGYNDEMVNIVLNKKLSDAVDGVISNSVSDYADYSVELSHTPAYATYGEENRTTIILCDTFTATGGISGGAGYEFSLPLKNIYTCGAPGEETGLYTRMKIGNVDVDARNAGVQAPYLSYTEDGFMYLGTQVDNGYYLLPDAPIYAYYPVNPAFSFRQAEGQVMGATSAVCVTYKDNRTWPSTFSFIAPSAYYGNYGELRNSDMVLATTIAEYNGEMVYDGETNIFEWASAWADNGHTPGEMKYIITDTNILVDDIPGSNVCTICYNEENEDQTPPSVQRVMFRTTDGDVTNRFTNASEGVVTLCGGDFVESIVPVSLGYRNTDFTVLTYAPATVEVSYAPYGESTFTAIEVTEDPEKFFMPGFGAYYEGSLAGVDRESANGWYDLKVVFTDEAGNTQSQVISPAFRIGDPSGVSSIKESKQEIFYRNGRIISTSGAEVTVYNTLGERVRNSNLGTGIYVARCGEAVTKIQVK